MEYFDSRPLYRDPVAFIHGSKNLKPQITSSIPPPLVPRVPIPSNHQNTVETPYAAIFRKRPALDFKRSLFQNTRFFLIKRLLSKPLTRDHVHY